MTDCLTVSFLYVQLVEASDDITDPPSSRPLTAFTTPALSSMAELPTRDCNVLENAEEVSDTVSEHQTSLQALLGTSSASSFMEDLNKWRKILQTIEAVLKLWMSVQDLWCLLREVRMYIQTYSEFLSFHCNACKKYALYILSKFKSCIKKIFIWNY